jgi:hypothetical protein
MLDYGNAGGMTKPAVPFQSVASAARTKNNGRDECERYKTGSALAGVIDDEQQATSDQRPAAGMRGAILLQKESNTRKKALK